MGGPANETPGKAGKDRKWQLIVTMTKQRAANQLTIDTMNGIVERLDRDWLWRRRDPRDYTNILHTSR